MSSSFVEENETFEAWLRTQCAVVEKDLKVKHRRMAESAFVFLRATFIRWASGIEAVCPEFASASPTVSVGDLHAENYGAWRDVEGRWVWGVNDFDEAAETPFAYDLVRLATSVRLRRMPARRSRGPGRHSRRVPPRIGWIPGRPSWTSRRPGCAPM